MKQFKKSTILLMIILIIAATFTSCGKKQSLEKLDKDIEQLKIEFSSWPEYDNESYIVVNNNAPEFTEDDMTTESYEYYSELDSQGRCGVVYANLGLDLMPTEERQSIGQVKPSGWKTVKYDNVDGKYLYNRCHLIGFQLSGENANEKNLITGTRYMNTEGMLPFENMVADYIKETGNHVLYRVTPIFEGDNLVASGVQMEAKSVEDNGEGICFNVYVYNVQPRIEIDYGTGESRAATSDDTSGEVATYIMNRNNKKFHYEDCSSVAQMKESNKQKYTGTREDLLKQGYEPCGNCSP